LLPAFFPVLDGQETGLRLWRQSRGLQRHFVDEKPVITVVIISAKAVPSTMTTTVGNPLSARNLEQEHLAYPEASPASLAGPLRYSGPRYVRELAKWATVSKSTTNNF